MRSVDISTRSPTFRRSLDSSVCIPASYTLDRQGIGVRFPAGERHHCRSIMCKLALQPTKSPLQWLSGALSPGIKRPGGAADHSPPSNDEIKNGGSIPPLPHTSPLLSASLITHRDTFTFPLYLNNLAR
jgi:hypothetical protein